MLHLAMERRHLRYLRRGSVFRETVHAPEQQGKFSSTTLIRSKPRVGFGATRWPLMRRPSRASFGVISPVTKTIGTSCSAQSASSCGRFPTPAADRSLRTQSNFRCVRETAAHRPRTWSCHLRLEHATYCWLVRMWRSLVSPPTSSMGRDGAGWFADFLEQKR